MVRRRRKLKPMTKEGKVKKRNDFLKDFKILERDSYVRFEMTVGHSLKIVSVASLKDDEKGGKYLQIEGWQFSMVNSKFSYCLHLLLEYMRYYAELNKLPMIADIPNNNLSMPEEQRNALRKLYEDHEFEKEDISGHTRYVSVLDDVFIPKKVDVMGMHYASTNRTEYVTNDHHHPEPQASPVPLEEEVPQEQG